MGFFSELELEIQNIAAQYHEFFILENKDFFKDASQDARRLLRLFKRKIDLPPYMKPIYVGEFIVGYYNKNSLKHHE